MATMQAALFDGKGGISVRSVTRPEVAGDYDVQCRLVYGATCTGMDLHILDGNFPYGGGYPTIPGHESVGRVVAVGAKVRFFAPGDLLTRVGAPAVDGLQSTWGGYAEWGLAKDHFAMAADGLPEAEWSGWRWCRTVPRGVDPRVAPLFTTWRETASFMRRLGIRPGWKVLVIGGGGNGLAFAAMAKNFGAATVALAGSARSAKAAGLAGVDLFADYRDERMVDRLREGGPYDAFVDSIGKAGQLDKVLPLAAAGAKASIYGIDDLGRVTVNPALAPAGIAFLPCAYDEAETHQTVSDWIRMGRLSAAPWYDVERPYDLADVARAFADLRARASAKALIRLE